MNDELDKGDTLNTNDNGSDSEDSDIEPASLEFIMSNLLHYNDDKKKMINTIAIEACHLKYITAADLETSAFEGFRKVEKLLLMDIVEAISLGYKITTNTDISDIYKALTSANKSKSSDQSTGINKMTIHNTDLCEQKEPTIQLTKFQLDKIDKFTGSIEAWDDWSHALLSKLGAAGYMDLIEDANFARTHPKQNAQLYYQLDQATSGGTAAYLITEYDDNKDGHSAYKDLLKEYEGGLNSKNQERKARDTLATLKHLPGSDIQAYYNKFFTYARQIRKYAEVPVDKKVLVNNFVKGIKDDMYG
ncbi:MAG: hypothetical protein ACRDL7_01770, partial [Gaiellaceae bacterium]